MINEITKYKLMEEGGKNFGNLKLLLINSVASKLPLFPLNGPAINPSIIGQMAEEAINELNKKSAFLYFFNMAEKSAIKPLKQEDNKIEKNINKHGGFTKAFFEK